MLQRYFCALADFSVRVKKYQQVAVDKFTKWIEYKPIVKISSDRAVDFISDIIHRFGLPHTIITDLGSNFTLQSFWDFCENSCIEVKYASVAHPRENGQVERINGLVLDDLKKRLYDANTKKGGKLIQELPPCGLGVANTT